MVNSFQPTDPNAEREWWVQQWLDLLQKYRFKKRLERGRNYARQGNVLSVEFKGKKAIARVQGTEAKPYQLSIWLDPFSDEDWEFVTNTLSEQAIYSAKLLAGEMPAHIEDAFASNGLRLFPFSLQEVRSRCSCPDKANPCKHIVAVYHLLGDRFGEDPFLLFQLRGRTKEEIVEALRERRSAAGEATDDLPQPERDPKATPLDPDRFWHYDTPLDPSLVVVAPPTTDETVLDVLGMPPLPEGSGGNSLAKAAAIEALREYLQTAYRQVSETAVTTAMNVSDDA